MHLLMIDLGYFLMNPLGKYNWLKPFDHRWIIWIVLHLPPNKQFSVDVVIMYITWPLCCLFCQRSYTHKHFFFLCIIYSEHFVYLADKFDSAVVYECFCDDLECRMIFLTWCSSQHWKLWPVLRKKNYKTFL